VRESTERKAPALRPYVAAVGKYGYSGGIVLRIFVHSRRVQVRLGA